MTLNLGNVSKFLNLLEKEVLEFNSKLPADFEIGGAEIYERAAEVIHRMLELEMNLSKGRLGDREVDPRADFKALQSAYEQFLSIQPKYEKFDFPRFNHTLKKAIRIIPNKIDR